MTAHIYPTALVGLRDGTLIWTAEEIRAVLLGPSFVYDPTDVYVRDLPAQHIIDTSDVMLRRSYSNGLAAAGPAAFLQLVHTQLISQVVLYQDTGDSAYSPLIAHYDVDSVLGAPAVAGGSDEYVYSIDPPGGFFQYTETALLGPINTYLLSDNMALSELEGGMVLVLPDVLLSHAMNVSTHAVCVRREEVEDCCEPTIRSSRC